MQILGLQPWVSKVFLQILEQNMYCSFTISARILDLKLRYYVKIGKAPSNVLPLHVKQIFPPIMWIFTEGEGDGIESRVPFKIFSNLQNKCYWFSSSTDNSLGRQCIICPSFSIFREGPLQDHWSSTWHPQTIGNSEAIRRVLLQVIFANFSLNDN